MITDMVEDVLVEHDYEVCGIARTVDQAVRLGRNQKPDLAVIDMQMAAGVTEVAAQLAAVERLGILYITGDISGAKLDDARGHACLAKPYRFADFPRSLVIELVVTGRASSPVPDDFEVLPRATSHPLDASHA